MENLEKNIGKIINESIINYNCKFEGFDKIITNKIMIEITKNKNEDFNTLLNLCEIVEQEKNGIIFIKKMIRNLIT